MRRELLSRAVTTALMLSAALADPTWPSPIDDLEEIMFQQRIFKSRNFADTISPCSNEASGPGRQVAAEWLRVAFHDMATADVRTGKGGLDGSLQYQLDDGESKGPGFNSTLKFFNGYLSKKTSLSDLIALGVYASVRSCGGPRIPVKAGRVDAPGPGRMGVPQPEHSIEQFRQQFDRMGFTEEEMIQVTACGHTLGGVHDTEFPELVEEGESPSDSTVSEFDMKVITEYLDNNTTNPLVVGPAVGQGKDSDARIFNSDANVTVKAMADPQRFQDVCRKVLQKMIEVVPAGVTLSPPIEPYMVKPVDLRLALEQAARHLQLIGNIRVKTTNLSRKEIVWMEILYKNRNGEHDCGKGSCVINSTIHGSGYGLDDTFVFFPIDATIPIDTGISSFVVDLILTNGTRLLFDNNGQGYPMQDAVLLLRRQTCLLQYTGKINVTAAVRNDRKDLPTNLTISYKVPRPGLPVAGLHETTMFMTKGDCVGPYTLFNAAWTIPGGVSYSSRTDVSNGEGESLLADVFTYGAELHGQCEEYSAPPASMCTTLGITATPSTLFPPPSTAAGSFITQPSAALTSTTRVSPAPTAGGHEFSKSIFRPVSGSIWETFMQYLKRIWSSRFTYAW
ncbi:hypothetical protein KVR01_003366 [Diaporthe batatas]|uniref:uncharacterized protein n=1 Tax=Diaporthe batatas TaxID=748121 RepID=UPI001D044DF6|nr:uncharacterized protein KVR01_003366 [Diaporthe batatas]KAG8167677.1 hypothetical protein KVR01_003366 [Diaporthe batatas]